MLIEKKTKYLKTLGNRIAEFRKNKGFSQSQLSDFVELDVMTISRIERGLLNISVINAFKISEALGISLKELFDFEI